MGCKSNIVSTEKDLENVPKRFWNVGHVCFDCKSNIVSTANKEQKNWGFSRLVRKKKKKTKK